MNKLKWKLYRFMHNSAHGTDLNMIECKIEFYEGLVLERLRRNLKDEETIRQLKQQLHESDTN